MMTSHYIKKLGWLSVDPLAEQFVAWSSYNYVYNNPIKYTDPDGMAPQDDYFDSQGNYLGSDNRSTNNIRIVTSFDLVVLNLDLNSSFARDNSVSVTDLHYGSAANRSLLTNIANHYADEAGITNNVDGVKEYPGAVMAVFNDASMFVSTDFQDISGFLENAFNFQNVIVHEEGHIGNGPETNLQHTERYLEQIDHQSYFMTTDAFKSTGSSAVLHYLNLAIKDGESASSIQDRIDSFNSRSMSTGVTYTRNGNTVEMSPSITLDTIILN
ncbi:hypothetical protein [Nonlabens xiamenensis]|uniref:hypothetical protein n=1 Tax=Nonlabens xiamenensis TaxID=2341043 RepID=UPI001982204D|nr:hypothetical protein [Nonlabens xiamenensis]